MYSDLNDLSLKELKDLSKAVERAIVEYEDRMRGKALDEVSKLAKTYGYALEDLVASVPVRRSKTLSAPKYRNPADPDMTWTGRGRKPLWVTEALAAGKKLEDLAI